MSSEGRGLKAREPPGGPPPNETPRHAPPRGREYGDFRRSAAAPPAAEFMEQSFRRELFPLPILPDDVPASFELGGSRAAKRRSLLHTVAALNALYGCEIGPSYSGAKSSVGSDPGLRPSHAARF